VRPRRRVDEHVEAAGVGLDPSRSGRDGVRVGAVERQRTHVAVERGGDVYAA